jgi:signal transduction histidine kinase
MTDFLTAQALWLVPSLAGLLIGALAYIIWKAQSPPQQPELTKTQSDQVAQSFMEKTELEVRLVEQADVMRMISEVHESAAASLSMLISQAEGAKFTAASDPQVASRAAEAIADSARSALNDIRRVVNVSRDNAQEVEGVPSLVSIHELFSAMTESGIVVELEESGTPFDIAPSAELAIYRILQEGLNNARTHGGPGTAVKVSMSWSAQGLHLRMDDDGSRAQRRFASEDSPAYSVAEDQAALVELLSGRGMKEMKTRTETFGGVFSAHRVPGVGFSLSAAFPTLKFHNGVHGVNTRASSDS